MLAVGSLQSAYAVAVDERNAKALAELFTGSASLVVDREHHDGRDAIVSFAAALPESVSRRHSNGDSEVRYRSDKIVVVSTEFRVTDLADPNERCIAHGRYLDVITLADPQKPRFLIREIVVVNRPSSA